MSFLLYLEPRFLFKIVSIEVFDLFLSKNIEAYYHGRLLNHPLNWISCLYMGPAPYVFTTGCNLITYSLNTDSNMSRG